MESYCLDFYEDSGDYILGLWNKLPASKKGLGSVSSESTPEKAIIEHTKIGDKSIPGFPTYFWISPGKGFIATIKLDYHVLGLTQFKSYIKGYMRNYCSHIVDREDEGEKIYGLCKEAAPNGQEDKRFPDKSLYTSFVMTVLKQEMGQDFLLNNAHNVSKIVKDISTSTLVKDENETAIEKLVRCFKDLPITKRKRTRVTMPVDLSYEHVRKLIKDYHDNDCSDDYNVGLIIRGDGQRIHWLDGTIKTEAIKGNLNMHTFDQPDLESLMSLIRKIGDVDIESADRKVVA